MRYFPSILLRLSLVQTDIAKCKNCLYPGLCKSRFSQWLQKKEFSARNCKISVDAFSIFSFSEKRDISVGISRTRKGRSLGYEDILHWQKIIVALVETDRIMKEIDKLGW